MSIRRKTRRLRTESLESRQLMAGDFGSDLIGSAPNTGHGFSEVADSFLATGSISYNAQERIVTVSGSGEGDDLLVHEDTDGSVELTYTSGFSGVVQTRQYEPGDVGKVIFHGEEGGDYFQNLSSIPSEAYGGDGWDTLIGGSGPDILTGNGGVDELRGKDGQDVLIGNQGGDFLYGGEGGDVLLGGRGSDTLKGGDGHDRISGGDGNDFLFGGGGMDGLFGGDGVNELDGGSGSDRFLRHYQQILGTNVLLNEDVVMDVSDNDTTIQFHDTNGSSTTIDGQDYDYDAGSWEQSDIETVDIALAELATVHGSNKFLETKQGDELVFNRVGQQLEWYFDLNTLDWETRGVDPEFPAYNSNGSMTFSDGALDDEDWTIQTVFHEIAHEWDNENPNWGEFKGISGWGIFDGPNRELSGNGDWFFDDTAGFARLYGKFNPKEDFATMFAKYMMAEADREYQGDEVGGLLMDDVIDEKLQFIEDFINED